MDAVVGSVYTDIVLLESGATGQAFIRLSSKLGTVDTVITLVFAELSNGAYQFSVTPSTAAIHSGLWETTDGELVPISFNVVTAAQADPAAYINAQGLVLVSSSSVSSSAGTLTIRRGDTTTWTIPLDADITGATIWFSVKSAIPAGPAIDLTDASAIINAYWIDGGANAVLDSLGASIGTISVASPAVGTVVITLTKEFTTTLNAATGLLWEVQIKSSDGITITTWTSGLVNVTLDLIRRVTVP